MEEGAAGVSLAASVRERAIARYVVISMTNASRPAASGREEGDRPLLVISINQRVSPAASGREEGDRRRLAGTVPVSRKLLR